MKARYLRRWSFGLVLMIAGLVAVASSPVQLTLTSFKVVSTTNEQGEQVERFLPAVQVAPGDVIEWRLSALNTAEEALNAVELVIPIPPETYYLQGSAVPLVLKRGEREITVAPRFSFDGGKTYGIPPLYREVKEVVNGKEVIKKVLVPPEDYTHVRWLLEVMNPGEQVEVTLRTVVR
ncbi:hypothetical protein [Oceanithermus sp.]